MKAVLIGSILPYMLKTDDNPDGVDQSVFDEMLTGIKDDRIAFLDNFGKQFFGVTLLNKPVSTPMLEYYRMLASLASPKATRDCAEAFAQTDFRDEMGNIKVPTLIIHGNDDKIVPIDATSKKAASRIRENRYIVYEGAPHALFYTERKRLNADLIEFIHEKI